MANSVEMQTAIMQVAIQAVTNALRAMREEDLPAEPHTKTIIPQDHHRPRQDGPMLSEPVFNWKVPDRYVELLNFEIEGANVPQAKLYDLNEEEKVPIIKNS